MVRLGGGGSKNPSLENYQIIIFQYREILDYNEICTIVLLSKVVTALGPGVYMFLTKILLPLLKVFKMKYLLLWPQR